MESAIDATGLQLLAIANILCHLFAKLNRLWSQLLHLVFEIFGSLSIIDVVALKDIEELSISFFLGLQEHSAEPPT